MAIEARILCSIEHPNIVKLRAISSKDLLMPGFFFIMDRLYDTLEKRLKKWQIRSQRANSFARILMDRSGLKKASLYEDRIVAAFDLSAALAYLHDRNIIYRGSSKAKFWKEMMSPVLSHSVHFTHQT